MTYLPTTHIRPTSKVIRRYLKPVPPDPEFERLKLDKKKAYSYRLAQRRNMCILCLKEDTQFLCLEYDDGCTKLERYCDTHIRGLEL